MSRNRISSRPGFHALRPSFPNVRGLHHLCRAVAAIVICGAGTLTAAEAPTAVLPENPVLKRSGDGSAIDSVVAAINGEVITLSDVLNESSHAEATLYALYTGDELRNRIRDARKTALDGIIERKLMIAQFKLEKLEVPPQYVETLLDDLAHSFGCKTRSELARKARQAGTTLEALRTKASERIMIDMLIGRLMYAKLNPTPREVQEYFTAHAEEFSVPEQFELQLLLRRGNDSPTAAELYTQLLAAPDQFDALAQEYSCGPAPRQGGGVGRVDLSKLRKEFRQALSGLERRTGLIVGPVATPEGDYLLKLGRIFPGSEPNLRQAAPEIRKRIETAAQTAAVKEYVAKLRRNAVIRLYIDGGETTSGLEITPASPMPEKAETPAAESNAAPSASQPQQE